MVGGEKPIVIDHNAAAFLTPVLQSVEAVVGQACQICRLLAEHAENAAFLMNTHFRPPREAAINPRNRGWGLLGRLLNSGWY